MVPKRHGQTDGQTDRQTDDLLSHHRAMRYCTANIDATRFIY